MLVFWLSAILLYLSIAEALILRGLGYAPRFVDCPAKESFVREANSLSEKEMAWLKDRSKVTQRNLRLFYQFQTNLSDNEYDRFLDESSEDPVRIALSFSGGGVRAFLTAAGEISALDNRTAGAFEHGLGGILQSSTYLAGLSGGNWLVGSLVLNNWSSVPELANDAVMWDWTRPMYEGLIGKGTFSDRLKSWRFWLRQVREKAKMGFRTSIVDFWSQSLIMRLLPLAPTAEATWSSIRNIPAFKNAEMPYPISLLISKNNQYSVDILNSTLMEANPYEFGTWEASGRAFTDMRYVGTQYINGVPTDRSKCATRFDNAGFIMATLSNIFDMGLQMADETVQSFKFFVNQAREFINLVNKSLYADLIIEPNPFFLTRWTKNFFFYNRPFLLLVDGGQDWQNIPLQPFLLEYRGVDAVMAFDNSADLVYLWPNASSLQYTYRRQFLESGKEFPFPPVPTPEEYLDNKMYKQPMFLGCDANRLSNLSRVPPMVIYFPNKKVTFALNFTTTKMVYSNSEKIETIRNGFGVATQVNLTQDADFRSCVGCAFIRRKQERLGLQQSDLCRACFARYCYY